MIDFKINGNPTQIPSQWTDLTFYQYVQIMDTKGILNTVSVLCNIDYEIIKKATISGLETVIEAVNFLKEVPIFDSKLEYIGKYKLPLNSKGEYNIQLESLGQFEDMREVMIRVPDNNIIEFTKAYAKYVAIYLQKLRDGEYDNDKAMAMVDEVYQMPAHHVIVAGGFFFTKLMSLLLGTTETFLITHLNQRRKQ